VPYEIRYESLGPAGHEGRHEVQHPDWIRHRYWALFRLR
jgi:hypothetical protein